MDYKGLYATFDGRTVQLLDGNGFHVRRFNMRDMVVGAQVSGTGDNTEVMITMSNGHWERYRWNGMLLRRG
jgi:hypothetical protein